MLYTKAKLGQDIEIKVPLYDGEIYTQCPECGTEHAIEPDIFAHIVSEGGDFADSSVFCEKCSQKETAKKAVIVKNDVANKITLNVDVFASDAVNVEQILHAFRTALSTNPDNLICK